MRKIWFIGIVLCLVSGLKAQFTDNFDNGNFTDPVLWSGDDQFFTVNAAFQLESNGPSAQSNIYLSTPSTAINNTQWEWFCNPRVATSSNNLFDIYIISNVAEVTGSVNGYFVRIGGTPDEVALFRKDGGTETRIIQGVQGSIASSSNNPTKVKIIRDANGNFELFADYTGTGNSYSLVGTVNDNTYSTTAFFGVMVRHSGGNFNRYIFDDVYVGDIISDDTPPELLSITAINQNQIILSFSEPVNQASAASTTNYFASGGLGNPVIAERLSSNFSQVQLSYGIPFEDGVFYTMQVTGVTDLAGNEMQPTELEFFYYRVKPYELVFNEIMADESPVVGLPPFEYIELFNRSAFDIDLNGWSYRTGNTLRVFPPAIVPADSFIVITSVNGAAAFEGINVIGLSSFPALANTGQTLTLLDPTGEIISTVTYSDTWYRNNAKRDGGWSLEMINPTNPCLSGENWIASEDPSGGTPGRRNSVLNVRPDDVLPRISRVVVLGADSIRVFFNKTVTLASSINPNDYGIDNGIGSPIQVTTAPPDFRSVRLVLANPLQEGIIYRIAISSTLLDCAGNPFNTSITGKFAIPSDVEPNDVVINELLSNPPDGGDDYVEIYNRSQKVLDLREMSLRSYRVSNNTIAGENAIAPDGFLIFPGEYLCLSRNTQAILNTFNTINPDGFVQMSGFPALNNDDMRCVLLRLSDAVAIDSMEYDQNSHFPLINNRKGISLERINFNRSSLDRTNWTSAAQSAGFGTPAFRNSQFSESPQSEAGSITVAPEVFSPDNDGFDDVLNITYTFDGPGFSGSITIFDSRGRLIRNLVRTQVLGTSGTYSWDGTKDNGDKAPVGIYIVYLDAFSADGRVSKLRKTCVLATRFQ
ncbi:MAG: lamin tail domain-containing protein [Flavobacteriales bacterium]